MFETTEQPATDSTGGNPEPLETADLPESTNETTEAELQAQQAAEEIEEELEGIKLRGPKEALEKLKAERLMQADYTRKTQEVAETRKSLEAKEADIQKAAQANQEERQAYGRLEAVRARLGQFAQVNWQAWADQDPAAASKAHMEFTQLQTVAGQLNGFLTQREQQKQLESERTNATRANEAEAVVMREVKDWGPQKLSKLVDYGKQGGIEPESLRQLLIQFPQTAKFLEKASLYDQLQKQRQAKPAATPAPPVTRIGGAAAASTKPLSEVSDAEFLRRRREYISKHR